MQAQEQQLIDGLFERLNQAERQATARDAEAERHIAERLARQPAAPYYMAQAIIVQESALQRLEARVRELEGQVESLRSAPPASGGGSFLSGLFGGAQPQASERGWREPARQTPPPAAPAPSAAPAASATGRAGSFLGGALQTATGVAGGMLVGNMLMNMFGHQRPEEIVEVIEPPAEPRQDAWAADDSGYQDDVQDAAFDDYPMDDFDDDFI